MRVSGECCTMELPSNATKSNSNSKQPNQLASPWVTLLTPWATIVIVATVSALLLSVWDERDKSTSLYDYDWMSLSTQRPGRSLLENTLYPHDDGTGGTGGGTAHSHAPIFNENHPSLFPIKTSDYYGLFFAVIGLVLAAGGGIGGGGILVPIYILVMGFSPKHAVPLSNVTVFGGAVANVILNTSKRHPLVDRPLVDWDLILVMEPLTIAGALIGAFLNKVLPELLLTVLLVLLLTSTAWETLTKATKMFKLETIALRKQGITASGQKASELTRIAAQSKDEQVEEAANQLLDDVEEQDSAAIPESKTTENKDNIDTATEEEVIKPKSLQEQLAEARKAELEQIVEDERVTPRVNLNILITLFVVVLAVNVLKGGGAFRSPLGIVCGSTGFWLANTFMIAWIVVISSFIRKFLLKKYYAKKRCGYQYVVGDIQWDERASLLYPCLCMFAGCFAGMFGVGTFNSCAAQCMILWVDPLVALHVHLTFFLSV